MSQKYSREFNLIKDGVLLGVLARFDADFPWHHCDWFPTDEFKPYENIFKKRLHTSTAFFDDPGHISHRREFEKVEKKIEALGLIIKEVIPDGLSGQELSWHYTEPITEFILQIDGEKAFWRS